MTEEQKLEEVIQAQPDFIDWLEGKFIDSDEVGGISITKDNVENLFDTFLENQDVDDMIKWADLYGQQRYLNGHKDCLRSLSIKPSPLDGVAINELSEHGND